MDHCCIKIEDRPTDWLMGDGNVTFKANIPSGEWTPYYHFNEWQKFVYESDLCVIFSEQEDIDAQIDWLISTGQVPQPTIDRLTQMGFMDVSKIDGKPHFHSSPIFTGSLTGNGMNGNPLPAPWDIVRKCGFLPWIDRPFTEATTPQEVLRKPTPDELAKARETLQYFVFNYHWVANGKRATPQMLAQARQMAPVQIGIAVSDTGYNQYVPSIPTATNPAHSILDIERNPNPAGELCADHYEPFLKVIVDGYPILYAIQGIVTPLAVPPPSVTIPAITVTVQPTVANVSILQQIVAALQKLVSLFTTSKGRIGSIENMNQYPWWVSSTGQGVAQRIISLVALVIPVLSYFGITIAQGDIESVINAAFIIAFAVWHLWAWSRANFLKDLKLGKYAPAFAPGQNDQSAQ